MAGSYLKYWTLILPDVSLPRKWSLTGEKNWGAISNNAAVIFGRFLTSVVCCISAFALFCHFRLELWNNRIVEQSSWSDLSSEWRSKMVGNWFSKHLHPIRERRVADGTSRAFREPADVSLRLYDCVHSEDDVWKQNIKLRFWNCVLCVKLRW